MEHVSFWSLVKMLIYWAKHTMRKNTEALSVSDKDVGVKVNSDKLRTDIYSQEQLVNLAAVP